MIAIFLSLLLVTMVAIAAVAAAKPDTFCYQRETVIQAPRETILLLVQDFRAWQNWSPWEALDPDMRKTYEGNERGVGARYSWEGNSKVGQGSMEIQRVDSVGIGMRLQFERPMRATNDTSFAFEPAESGGTLVRWSMTGRQNLLAKIIGLFVNMDRMIGSDFERGLAALKALAERTQN